MVDGSDQAGAASCRAFKQVLSMLGIVAAAATAAATTVATALATDTAGESYSPTTPAAGAPAGGSAPRTGTPETATNGARPAADGGRQRAPLYSVALLRARWAGAELRHLGSWHRSGRTALVRCGGLRAMWFEEHSLPSYFKLPPKHQEIIFFFFSMH